MQVDSIRRSEKAPSAKERNGVFSQVAGLTAYTKNMDELEQDLLFIRARDANKSLSRLVNDYPKIPKEKLKRLQKNARKEAN